MRLKITLALPLVLGMLLLLLLTGDPPVIRPRPAEPTLHPTDLPSASASFVPVSGFGFTEMPEPLPTDIYDPDACASRWRRECPMPQGSWFVTEDRALIAEPWAIPMEINGETVSIWSGNVYTSWPYLLEEDQLTALNGGRIGPYVCILMEEDALYGYRSFDDKDPVRYVRMEPAF